MVDREKSDSGQVKISKDAAPGYEFSLEILDVSDTFLSIEHFHLPPVA